MLSTRRAVLAGLAATPLAACAATQSAPIKDGRQDYPTPTLDALARARGRKFGTAVAWNEAGTGMSLTNPRYADLVRAECGLIVPENEMKWQSLRPAPDRFDFSAMDRIAAWAQQNAMDLRAHVLLWHRAQWFPEWLNNYDFGTRPASEAERVLTDHIRTVTGRYKDQITSWDVVNEAIDHQTNAPIQTSLSRAMGSAEAVIDLAFHTARDAMPDAQLVYNDYMSWEPDHAKHCADVLRLLEGMKTRGTPCDALGIQSHIEMFSIDPATGLGPYDEAGWRAFLNEVTGMGYRLLVTEFDVKDRALPADITVRDKAVADFTRRYFDVMSDYAEHLDDILAWGLVDRYNWLQYFDPAKRDDGQEIRGCPYGSDYAPKPLREALAQALSR